MDRGNLGAIVHRVAKSYLFHEIRPDLPWFTHWMLVRKQIFPDLALEIPNPTFVKILLLKRKNVLPSIIIKVAVFFIPGDCVSSGFGTWLF